MHHTLGFIELEPLVLGGIDLVFVIVALFCLLMVGAGWVILWILHITLGKISIFGAHPFNFFYGLATAALQSVFGQLVKRLVATGHFFYSLAMAIWRPLYVIFDVLTGLVGQMLGISHASSDGLAQLRAQEQADISAAQAKEAADFNLLTDELVANVRAIQSNIDANVAAINAKEATDFGLLTDELVANVRAIQSNIDANVTSLRTTEQSDVLNLNNRITSVQTVLGNALNADVQSLQAADAANLNAAEAFATSAVGLASPGIVAQAVAAVQAQLRPIQTELTECLDPLCNTVTPQAPRLGRLGQHFASLESLGIEALLIALAAEAVHNPGAVARDIETVVNDVGGGALTGFRDLVGI